MIERRPRRHVFGEEGESEEVDRTVVEQNQNFQKPW